MSFVSNVSKAYESSSLESDPMLNDLDVQGGAEPFSEDFDSYSVESGNGLGSIQASAATVEDLKRQLSALLSQMTKEQKSQLAPAIQALQARLSGLSLRSGAPAEAINQFKQIQSQVLGGSDAAEDWGPDNPEGAEEAPLKSQIATLLKDPNLIENHKSRLEKMQSTLALHPKNAEQIGEDFETLKEEATEVQTHGEAALRLSQALGMKDISAAAKLMAKYHLDPAAKKFDPKQIVEFLKDPEVAAHFAEAQQGVKEKQKSLDQLAPKKAQEAHAQNQTIDAKDTSKVIDVDYAPFKWIHDTLRGESQEMLELAKGAQGCGQKLHDFLAQVFKIEATGDAKNPGMLELGGGVKVNAVDFDDNGGPSIHTPTNLMPVALHADLEGDGNTQIPDWMKKSHYPVQSIDEGGWNPLSIGLYFPLAFVGGAGIGVAAAYGGNEIISYSPDDPYGS